MRKHLRSTFTLLLLKVLTLAMLAVVLLVGCGNNGSPAKPSDSRTVPVPDFVLNSSLVLPGAKRLLHIGDSQEAAFRCFPAPTKSYAFNDLPGIFQPPFTAKGWETGFDGFGVICYEGRVSVAIRQFESLDDAKSVGAIQQVLDANPGAQIIRSKKDNIQKWSLSDNGQAIVMFVTKSPKGNAVKIALGHADSLSAIGIKVGPLESGADAEADSVPSADNSPREDANVSDSNVDSEPIKS